MVKKYTILTLLAFGSMNFNASAIGAKGLTLAVAGTGFATKLALEGFDVDSKYAIGAGVLAGTALGAALIRRDCRNYKKLMQSATDGLEYAKQHRLIKDLVICNGLKQEADYARFVLDSELRKLYPSKRPYSDAKYDLDRLADDLSEARNDFWKARELIDHSSPTYSLKKPFIGSTEQINVEYQIGDKIYQNSLDVKFKKQLVDSHLWHARYSRSSTSKDIVE